MTAPPPTPTSPPPTAGDASASQKFAALAGDIKLHHSVFALPFAVLAAFVAAADRGALPDAVSISLIVVCMVLARTMAMSVNRWADATLDAANPRTAGRAIPSGRLDAKFVLGTAIVCGAGLVLAAAAFWPLGHNPWPLAASPVVLAVLAGYSFTKRFTWLCHIVLGAALALSPLAAALALNPASLARPELYLLSTMVLCWVAGFDVIYALQDVETDRRQGLFSMPSRLGVEPALWVSRALHAGSLAALMGFMKLCPHTGAWFGIGVLMVAGLLVLEHAMVWGSKLHRIPMAFFTVNGVISLLLGAAGVYDIVSRF